MFKSVQWTYTCTYVYFCFVSLDNDTTVHVSTASVSIDQSMVSNNDFQKQPRYTCTVYYHQHNQF